MKKIILKISPKGEMQIRVEGACGEQCKELSRPFEEALGVVSSDVATDEMYAAQEQSQEVSNQ